MDVSLVISTCTVLPDCQILHVNTTRGELQEDFIAPSFTWPKFLKSLLKFTS